MKYVITGAAGNISKPLAEKLLAAGHDVTVIGRNPDNLKKLTDKGAKAAIGTIEDVKFLRQTFEGADAVYTMVPPQYVAGTLDDYHNQGKIFSQAIKSSGVKYVVNLSSVGAHLEKGCGPVTGLHVVEEEMNKLEDVNILHLRPGYFYLNLLNNIDMIKHMNIIGGNYGDSSATMILSHPEDIAQIAAEAMLKLNFTGHVHRYLASDVRTTGEIASVLGSAIGKPDLPWVAFTDEQSLGGMKQAGLPEPMAEKYTEMGKAMRTGIMWEDFLKHQPAHLGKTKLENFASSFAAAYNN